MATVSKEVVTGELLGCPCDFLIETETETNIGTVRVTTIFPKIIRQDQWLLIIPPPHYPWPTAQSA
ncbi:MAG: hypothetical protein ABSA97_07280 [Verrucomicrobiia bacterium]